MEELERDRSDAFQPLPFHYIEIAHLLFTHAKDAFAGDFYRVSDGLENAWLLRHCILTYQADSSMTVNAFKVRGVQ